VDAERVMGDPRLAGCQQRHKHRAVRRLAVELRERHRLGRQIVGRRRPPRTFADWARRHAGDFASP
jgi:hypothetical protein